MQIGHLSVYSLLALVSLSSVFAFDPYKMLCLVNVERSNYGLNNLGADSRLDYAAAVHSQDMANMGVMTHTGSDYSDPAARLDVAGFPWESVAENIANGYDNEEECMQQWMESPGHRANILSEDSTHFGSGAGYSGDGNPYYTQVFAGDGQYHNFPACPYGGGYDDTVAAVYSYDDSWNYAQPETYDDGSWDYSGGHYNYDDGNYSEDIYDDGNVSYGEVQYDDGNYNYQETFYDDGSLSVDNVNEIYDDGTTWDGGYDNSWESELEGGGWVY